MQIYREKTGKLQCSSGHAEYKNKISVVDLNRRVEAESSIDPRILLRGFCQ